MGPDVMIPTPMGKLGELPPARELSTGDDVPVPGKTLVERFRERAKRLIGR